MQTHPQTPMLIAQYGDWLRAMGVTVVDLHQWRDHATKVLPAAQEPRIHQAAPAVAVQPVQTVAAASLAELRAQLEAHSGFADLRAGARNLVFADGSAQAPLMVIGDIPDEEDDAAARPFAGASGQLLDKMLAAIGIEGRAGYYVTTLSPWRPVAGQALRAEEVAALLPFLHRHIALVQPKILLVLGGGAAKALFDSRLGVNRLRGTFQMYTGPDGQAIPMLATFHPAYLLQAPAFKKLAWQDLQILRDRLYA